MAVKLSRKGIVLLSLLVLLIIGGVTGYIVWRTYQKETVEPTDSEAGGGGNGSCCNMDIGCVAGYTCVQQDCSESEPIIPANCGQTGEDCAIPCGSGRCRNLPGITCNAIPWQDGTECTVNMTGNKAGRCVKDDDVPPSNGSCADYFNSNKNGSCEWPNVLITNTTVPEGDPAQCSCGPCQGTDTPSACSPSIKPPTCKPSGGCPEGEIECGTSDEHEEGNGCKPNFTKSCVTNHSQCNNPSYTFLYCKPETVVANPPACTGLTVKKNGTTVTNPTVQASDALTYTLTATDPDGAPSSMMICFALAGQTDAFYTATNGANWYCQAQGAGTTYTINTTFETIKNAYIAKVPSITEQQIIDNGFTVATNIFDNVASTTSFCTSNPGYVTSSQAVIIPDFVTDPSKTCSAAGVGCNSTLKLAAPPATCGDGELNPELGEECEPPGEPNVACTYGDCSLDCKCPGVDAGFEVEKTGAGICVEGTSTYSDVTYTITVQNNGSTVGHISQVVDTLDPDIDESWILQSSLNPSTGVTIAAGTITWDLTGDAQTFDPGEDMTFSYTLRVPEAAFGSYTNSVEVVVTDEGADNVTDELVIDVSCAETPVTGIFDSVAGRIAVASILIIASAIYLYSDKFDGLLLSVVGTSGRLNRTRSKFEKKTANKRS